MSLSNAAPAKPGSKVNDSPQRERAHEDRPRHQLTPVSVMRQRVREIRAGRHNRVTPSNTRRFKPKPTTRARIVTNPAATLAAINAAAKPSQRWLARLHRRLVTAAARSAAWVALGSRIA